MVLIPAARRAALVATFFLVLPLVATGSVSARVDVTLDQTSLNDLLGSMAPEEVPLNLPGGRRLHLLLQDLRVTGFDPGAGETAEGHVLTSMTLKLPELGLSFPVTPRLSLQFKGETDQRVAFLRFEELAIDLPVAGRTNIAPLLPVLPLIARSSWTLSSARGNVRVQPRLADAKVGQRALRLGFELDVTPLVPAGGGKPGER